MMTTTVAGNEREDVSTRLDRLERMVGRLVDLVEHGSVAVRADALAGRTPHIGTVPDRLSQALLEISEPEVLGALTRIATLAPQLEAAAHAAAAAPELLEEALDVIRERVGDDAQVRVQAAAHALAQLSQPKVLEALGRIGGATPGLAGPMIAAARATAEVSAVVGSETVDSGVHELVRTVLDPEVLQSLVRIAGLVPQLEYAVFGAAALPELLDEGLAVIREQAAGIDDGLPLADRIAAVTKALHALSRPDRVARATQMVETLMPTLDRFAKLPVAAIEGGLELLERVARPETRTALDGLLDRLPSLAQALDALPSDPKTLALLSAAAGAIGHEVGEQPRKLGLFGLLRALRDPKVQATLGFGVAVAARLGEDLDSGKMLATRPSRQLPSGK